MIFYVLFKPNTDLEKWRQLKYMSDLQIKWWPGKVIQIFAFLTDFEKLLRRFQSFAQTKFTEILRPSF